MSSIWSPAKEVDPEENILPQLLGETSKEIPPSPGSCSSSASSSLSAEVLFMIQRQTALIESQARASRCLEKTVKDQADIHGKTNQVLEKLVTIAFVRKMPLVTGSGAQGQRTSRPLPRQGRLTRDLEKGERTGHAWSNTGTAGTTGYDLYLGRCTPTPGYKISPGGEANLLCTSTSAEDTLKQNI